MNKTLRALAAAGALTICLTACGSEEPQGPPKPSASASLDDWCYAKDWVHSATSTYYYLHGDDKHSLKQIRHESDYGGWLMNSWQEKINRGELPKGIEPDLQAWAEQLTVMQQRGVKIGDYTDKVLDHCRN